MIAEYSKQSIKTLRAIDEKTRQRIKHGIDNIPKGDIKSLIGAENVYRLRIGTWRILFSYKTSTVILISKISPRGTAYKGV